VPTEVPLPRRAATALSWPAGVLWTSWLYIWRTTPLHRRQLDGALPDDLPPALPDGVELGDAQGPDEGEGPLLHRIYTARYAGARLDPEGLMACLQADPDRVAPRALSKFRKTAGEAGSMRVGDEFLVHMPGPWDGPVRVVAVTPRSFRFATLQGHLEAGQIEWRAGESEGRLTFQIESWARAGDRLSAIMHDRLLMAKEVQLHMWSSVLERVGRLVEGRLERGLDIETRRVGGADYERARKLSLTSATRG
jgi:Domain of unknown function (DUF1990)